MKRPAMPCTPAGSGSQSLWRSAASHDLLSPPPARLHGRATEVIRRLALAAWALAIGVGVSGCRSGDAIGAGADYDPATGKHLYPRQADEDLDSWERRRRDEEKFLEQDRNRYQEER